MLDRFLWWEALCFFVNVGLFTFLSLIIITVVVSAIGTIVDNFRRRLIVTMRVKDRLEAAHGKEQT